MGRPDQVASDGIAPEIQGERRAGEEATEETPAPLPTDQEPEQPLLQDRRRPK